MLDLLDKTGIERAVAATDAMPDSAIWTSLGESGDAAAFGRAWLTLACRSFEAIDRGALLLGRPDIGPFRPVARWSAEPELGGLDGFVSGSEAVLAAAIERKRPALEGVGRTGGPAGAGAGALLGYPLMVSGALHGVVLARAPALDQGGARRLVRHLQWSSGWIEAFLRRAAEGDAASLSDKADAVIHAVEAVVAEARLVDAARVFAGLVEDRFGCNQVALGRAVRRHTRLIAVSQTAVFEARSRHAKLLCAAADEAIDQGTSLSAPASADLPFVTAAQEALRRDSGGADVLSVPLVAAGEAFGAVILLRNGKPFTQAELDLVDALGTAVAPVLAEKSRTDRNLLALAGDRLSAFAGRLFGARHLGLKLGVATLVAAIAFLSLATQEYRIRARAEVQGEVRRSLSAPFDGFIRSAQARAGDVVPEGAILAELQDNDLVLDRLRHLSRKRQYQSELDKALAKRDLAGTNIAQAQVAQADADIELTDQMLTRAQLKAPFPAVIVSGDLSQTIGRPVSRGDTLFEIAPLDRYRVTIVVPESDVRLVSAGMRGEILLSALPERPFGFEIRSVTPVARASEGVNGFEALGALTERDERIRPGMEGIAKIQAGERSLVWIWAHPFIQWSRIKVWGWFP